ncbi:hypothetical protein [Acidocella facilis]|nr:hypothetical protein [Acidocella facilis]
MTLFHMMTEKNTRVGMVGRPRAKLLCVGMVGRPRAQREIILRRDEGVA